MSGQSIMDRVVAAKHSIAGQGLAKIVCKATTEEVMGPKKKHLDYLLQCTNEPNVSIPQLADLLIDRTQHANWVIVFKGLITIHNLMNYGNERFTQYLASNNCTFNLGNFLDKQGVQGYDMSKFIRKYSTYMNEKAVSYRAMAFDFCKVKRGKDDGLLRTMACEKLLKALPVLQKQLDALLEFDCTPNELTNGVVNACFMLLFKDLIRLFACYNDGIINLLEKYFDMNKKQCKEGLDIYKKFLVRMDKVSEFLKVAENVGIDKGDIPDLAKAPASLLDALEQHLNSLEGKKGVTTPTSKPAGFATAIDTISGNSSVQVSEEEKKRILEEEKNKLQELKEQHSEQTLDLSLQDQRMKEMKSSPSTSPQNAAPATNNPFLTTKPATANVDLFGAPAVDGTSTGKASDDLLNLTGNPFVENVRSVMSMNSTVTAMTSQNAFSTPGWGSTNANSGTFTSDADFAKVFQNSNSTNTAGFDAFGDVLQPISSQTKAQNTKPDKAIQGDLDSSLANLAGNLHMDGPASQVKKTQHEWQPKNDSKKTGGSNWAPQPITSNTSWGQSGFGSVPATGPRVGYPAAAPGMAPNQGMMPMGMVPQPGMGMVPQPGMGISPQPGMGMGMGMSPAPGAYGAPTMPMGVGMMPQQTQPMAQPKQPSDPFGAL